MENTVNRRLTNNIRNHDHYPNQFNKREMVNYMSNYIDNMSEAKDMYHEETKVDILDIISGNNICYPTISQTLKRPNNYCVTESMCDQTSKISHIMETYKEKILYDRDILHMLVGMVNFLAK